MKKANRDALLDVRCQWFIVGCSQHMMAAFSKYSVYLFLHVFYCLDRVSSQTPLHPDT